MRRTDDGAIVEPAREPGLGVLAGRYEMVELLAEGPHSIVRRAVDRATGRSVVVKITAAGTGPALPVLRDLAHPHAATTIDAGVLGDGRRFTVTDFLPGPTLRQVLDGGLPQPSVALRWMAEVLDALAAVHRCGVVHCDVKPENVVVTGTGGIRRAVLVDFGLARTADAPADGVAGTPRYAAPEQLHGESVGTGADLYAWALMLLECLGAPPVTDADARRTAAQRSSLAPVTIPPELGRTALGALIRELLEHDATIRPADASRTLERLLRTAPRIGALGGDVACMAGDVTVLAARQRRAECADARRMADDFAAAAALLRARGGTLVSATGTVLVAAFGLRDGDGGDARAAVDAGIALLRHFEEAPPGSTAWAVGIDCGSSSSRGIGPLDGVELLSGEVYDIAARISESTREGRLAVSGRALAACGGAREATFVGTVGTADGVLEVHQWKREGGAPPLPLRRIAGRDAEITRLRALWQEAQAGAARAVLLHGTAGIGKTMLARELAGLAGGATVFATSCRAERSSDPYSAVRELLSGFDGSALAMLRRYGLDPSYAGPLGTLRSDLRSDATADTPELRRQTIEDVVIELLLRAAAESPVLVLLEDLHWADPSTSQLLSRLLVRLREPRSPAVRLLVAGTSREAEPAAWAHPHVERIEVRPIAAPAAAELLTLHCAPGTVPAKRTVTRAARLSRGVPLFLDQAARLLACDPSAAIPDTLDQVLATQVARLGAAAARVAVAAAAIGADADAALLSAICAVPLREAVAAIDEIDAAGLLVREPGSSSVQFTHELVREAVLATVDADERRELHRRIARALEKEKTGIGFERPAELALHLERSGDRLRAAELWHRAAVQALEKAAYPEARQAFQRAGGNLDGLPDSQEVRLRRLGIATGIGSAEIAMRGFGAAEARTAFLEARSICDALGREAPLEVLGAIFGSALVTADDEVGRIIPYFEELAKRTEDPLRCFAGHQVLSVHALWCGRFEDSARHARVAVELYRRDSVRNVAWEIGFGCHSLAYRMSAEFHCGHAGVAEAARLEMLERVESYGNPAMIAVGLGWSTTLTIDTGRYEETLEIVDRLSRICREQHLLLWAGYASLAKGAALAGLGSGAEAVAPVREGLAILDAVGVRCGAAYYLAYLARALLADDRPQEAFEAADQGIALCRSVWTRFQEPELLRLRGLARKALGRHAQARRDLREALAISLADGGRSVALRVLCDLVELRDRGAKAELARLAASLDGDGETEDLRRARRLVSTAR